MRRPPSFEDFIGPRCKHLRSAWTYEPGIELYFRRPTGYSHNADWELASMKADKPGNGALTAFLDRFEPQFTFMIENVLEDRLAAYFERRGYRIVGNEQDLDRCLIAGQCHHYKDELAALRTYGLPF